MNTLTTLSESNAFTIGSNFLEVTGTPSNEQWLSGFHEISKMQESIQWILGDFLIAAEARGKDILKTFGDQVGYDHKTMYKIRNAAQNIPREHRIDGISWTHHREAFSYCKKSLVRMTEELILAKKNNLPILAMKHNIKTKSSDPDLTDIPDITRNKDDKALTNALNAVTDLRRFVNNTFNKIDDTQQALFIKEFNDLVTLVEEETK